MPTLDRRTTFNKYSSITGLQSVKIEDTNKSPELKNQVIIPIVPGGNTTEAVIENNIHNRNDTQNTNPPLPSIDDDHTFQLE